MPEMVTISKDELARLEERARKLAMEKSFLQLSLSLMNRLSAVSGLENTVENMLRIVADNIGGNNLIIYFIDKDIYYADVYGKKIRLESIDDIIVRKVFETRELVEIEQPFSYTKMTTLEFTKASSCAVPLMVGPDIVGVLKMEGMHMSVREVSEQFQPFFNYAALILKNEMLGHTRLKKAYDELNETNARLCNEIIQRKEAESSLLITQFAVDHASDSLFWITPDARFANVNDSTCRRLGYSRDELLNMTVFDVDPAFPRETWDSHWQEIKERKSFTIQTKHRTKAGEVFPVEVTVNYVDYAGSEYNFAFARDISERKRAEEELHKANEELEKRVIERTAELHKVNDYLQLELEERKRTEKMIEKERNRMDIILSALNTGLSLINPDMTIAWVNHKVREMFPGKEPVGQVCHVFYESRATICEGCGTLKAFMDGKVCESEQLVPATGRWYYIISQPIIDADGRVVNVLEGITDITDRKIFEEELRKLNQELEQRVIERTEELKIKNSELERLNKIFVGRELRMIELKTRIKELQNQGSGGPQ